MRDFRDIYDIDTMIHYLKEKGENHESYYHYTSWDSLVKIMQNKSFLLTRGNSLSINDYNEARKGSREEWNRTFIGSFSFGSAEIMAMWGLYCLPWSDAVRISIPKDKMNRWQQSIHFIKPFVNGRTVEYRDRCDVSLNDIVYVEGTKGSDSIKLKHGNKVINIKTVNTLLGVDISPRMTGYIKNSAWKYENEVRLRIQLENNNTSFDRISVDIPCDVVDSFIITSGPYFQAKNDALYRRLKIENRIKESGFTNDVNYRELCSLCQHESFLKKE